MKQNINWNIEKGTARKLLSQPKVKSTVDSKADEVVRQARALARSEAYDTGAYAGSFSRTSGRSRNGDRPVAIVEVTDWKWKIIEYGSRSRPGRHIVKRAMESAGLKGGKMS